MGEPVIPQPKGVSDQTPSTSAIAQQFQPQRKIVIIRAKEQKPLNLSPFNVVEQLKKSSANVSLWIY